MTHSPTRKKNAPRKIWTAQDIALLRASYGNVKLPELSVMMGRTVDSLHQKASMLCLCCSNGKPKGRPPQARAECLAVVMAAEPAGVSIIEARAALPERSEASVMTTLCTLAASGQIWGFRMGTRTRYFGSAASMTAAQAEFLRSPPAARIKTAPRLRIKPGTDTRRTQIFQHLTAANEAGLCLDELHRLLPTATRERINRAANALAAFGILATLGLGQQKRYFANAGLRETYIQAHVGEAHRAQAQLQRHATAQRFAAAKATAKRLKQAAVARDNLAGYFQVKAVKPKFSDLPMHNPRGIVPTVIPRSSDIRYSVTGPIIGGLGTLRIGEYLPLPASSWAASAAATADRCEVVA